MDQVVAVDIATGGEYRDRVIGYIREQMERAFGCPPPETSGVIFVARSGDRIIGTLVYESTSDQVPFQIEARYRFIDGGLSQLAPRSAMVVGTRWIGTEPGASWAVLRFASIVAVGFGKRYALIEGKPYTAKRLRELGALCTELSGAHIDLDRTEALVGLEGMVYYRQSPAPRLYIVDLAHIVSLG